METFKMFCKWNLDPLLFGDSKHHDGMKSLPRPEALTAPASPAPSQSLLLSITPLTPARPGFLSPLNIRLCLLLGTHTASFAVTKAPAASLLDQQPVSSTMKGREAKMHTLLQLQQWKHFPPPSKILRILAHSRTCTGALPGRTPPLEFCTSFLGPPISLWPSFLFDFNLQRQLSQGTSQVVQCLGLCLPRQGVRIQSLDGELRSHVPQGQKNPKHKTEVIS